MKKKTLPKLPPIPDKRYFKISEASELIGVPDYMLRYWEAEIPQFSALRRGTHRRYRPQDIQMGRLIRELKFARGLTTEGIKNALAEYKKSGTQPVVEAEERVDVAETVPAVIVKPDILTDDDLTFLDKMVASLLDIKEFLRNK
ncbi:MAG: MerR family transcriptional regulator [Burkholderiales bacterium]|nr:MerR family transcriptional regulator [Burkholderiales bacterium]